MAEAKKKPSKKIIDVAQPGKTPPAGNSKSVIVTNRPIMKDPMMVDEAAGAEKPAEKVVAKSEAVIAPLADNATKDESKDKASAGSKKADAAVEEELKKEDDKKTIAVLAEEAAVKKEEAVEADKTDETDSSAEPAGEETAPETELPDVPPESDSDSEADKPESEKPAENVTAEADDMPDEEPVAETDKTDDKPESDQPKTDQSVAEADAEEAAKQEKHDAAIKKLVDSKQYFLPINSVEKRRSKRVMALGIILSILLVLLWIDIALDASLIEIEGVKPVTHFFSN